MKTDNKNKAIKKQSGPTNKTKKREYKQTGKKRGKPELKEIDFDELNKLINFGHTGEECADWFNIDYDTLNKRIKEKFKISFSEYHRRNIVKFKSSLRRLQFQSAMGIKEKITKKDSAGKDVIYEYYAIKPSTDMQKFLGKQYLGQTEKVENTMVELSDIAKKLEDIFE